MTYKFLPLLLLVAACNITDPKPDPMVPTVMVKDKYVIVTLGEDATKLPPPVPPIADLKHATQRDIADWLLKNEARMNVLEDKVTAFKNMPGNAVEKLKLKPDQYIVVDLSKQPAERPAK